MHHEEIELNFDALCQQIFGLESEILWEARSTPTLVMQSSGSVSLTIFEQQLQQVLLVKA
jgi:hypothetical protein